MVLTIQAPVSVSFEINLEIMDVPDFQAALDWAYPLRAGERVKAGSQRVHFSLGVDF